MFCCFRLFFLPFLLGTLPHPHSGKHLWFAGNWAGSWGQGAVGAGGWGWGET